MPKFDKIAVISKMAQAPIVPVYNHSDIEVVCKILKACYDGGVRVFEFTNRGDFAHEVFVQVIKYVAIECPDMAVGIGSIIDSATAAMYIQNGACFVVGPLFNPRIASVCNRRMIPYIPGCGTVSEVGEAQEIGCDVCKVFPGDVLTPRFVKGLLAPMPWSKLMVTGGVEPTEDNITAWFKAGAFCVGMGSKLFPEGKIACGDWQFITNTCESLFKIISNIKR